MSRARAAVCVVGGLIVLSAAVLGATVIAAHEAARGRWEEHGRGLLHDDPGYDAARSDRLYDEVLGQVERAGRVGSLAALGALVLVVGWPAGAGAGAGASAGARRAALATLVDVLVPAVGLGLAYGAQGALGADHAAAGELAWAFGASATLLGWLVTWKRGRTAGARTTGLIYAREDGSAPGLGPGLLAAGLSPLGLLATPAWAPRGRPPPHLAWAGLTALG